MRSFWPYATSVFGCYLLWKAIQEVPINPLTLGAIMPLVLVGPTARADQVIRRLSSAGKALTKDPENGK